jgi:RNA polymerase sigma factor (sigma-70 family)
VKNRGVDPITMPKPTPFAALIEEHYATLRRLAARAIRTRSAPERMSPTSLVAESVMRLLQQRNTPRSEEHLRGLATVFMARVLADNAKARLRLKRGGGRSTRSIDDPSIAFDLAARSRTTRSDEAQHATVDRTTLLDAMTTVAEHHPRAMEVLTLHVVGGIPLPRVAELVGISERTAYRELELGRAELSKLIRSQPL